MNYLSYMQPIDPNKLFDIFQAGDEEIYKEHGMSKVMNSPYVLLGMVVRGVENFNLMDVMYSRQYPKEYKRNRKNIIYRYFTKLFSYLDRIEDEPSKVVEELEQGFDYTQIIMSLDFMREYFEKIEHYEKCAVIKKYIDTAVAYKENVQ